MWPKFRRHDSLVLVSMTVFIFCAVSVYHFTVENGTNPCQMTYMFEYPQYVKINMTDHAGKIYDRYSLYAYSEGKFIERARAMRFTGIPILFVPGHGGSYKQVRSLASVTTHRTMDLQSIFHFDFFTIDFNGELSALYGGTLMDQHEFMISSVKKVLKLYPINNHPKSVIIIGHSMGGMIARSMFMSSSFDASTVKLIITLATPHKPVILIDENLKDFYSALDTFWEREKRTKINRLGNLTLISIGGGIKDVLVRPELTFNELADLNVLLANYATYFYTQIKEFFATGQHTDVIIRCQNREFRCHRVVLAAASEYFDAMFSGYFRESNNTDVVLHDIDSDTLEEVLRFVYEGDILGCIDDENVYSLLRASDIFRLEHIESRCIRYLIERNVPMQHALQIFSFVCVTGKRALMPTVSRFILENLNLLSREAAFLNMSRGELSVLLSYFQPSSSDRERSLLDALLRWISYSALPFEKGKPVLAELTRDLQFNHMSTERIAQYFQLRMDSGSEMCDDMGIDEEEAPVPELSLHVYINTSVESSIEEDFVWPAQKPQSNLFTLQGCNGDIDWSAPSQSGVSIDHMRTVVVNDQLYSLKSPKKWGEFTFSSCLSADPSADTRSLTAPFDANWLRSNYFNLMCSGTNDTIYVCSSHRWNDGSLNLFSYNCELDKWFSITTTGLNKQFAQTINMTWHDGRIYLIGNGSQVQAYDHRAGTLARLTDCSLSHANGDECCSHKEKIYVSSARDSQRSVQMESYDPVAEKWDTIDMMQMTTTDECRQYRPLQSHRLLSFDNQLWMFSSHPASIYVETYDSFLRKWETSDTLHNAVQNRIYPTNAIPGVITSTDHLCIVWCNTFVKTLSRALYDAVDFDIRGITEDRRHLRNIFHYHLVHCSNGKYFTPEIHREKLRFTKNSTWREMQRNFTSSLAPYGLDQDMHLLVKKPKNLDVYDSIMVEVINVDKRDWIAECNVERDNRLTYCDEGDNLSRYGTVGFNKTFRRKYFRSRLDAPFFRKHLQYLIVKLPATDERTGLTVDMYKEKSRTLHVNLDWSFFLERKTVLKRTKSKALFYTIRLNNLKSIWQVYHLHLIPTECSRDRHLAFSVFKTPWNYDSSHVKVDWRKGPPLKIVLLTIPPARKKGVPFVELILDPKCQYSVQIEGSYLDSLGVIAVRYALTLTANLAALLLLVLVSQYWSLARENECPSFLHALKTSRGAYLVYPGVKLFTYLWSSYRLDEHVFKLDTQVLSENTMDNFAVSILIYFVSLAILYVVGVALHLSILLYVHIYQRYSIAEWIERINFLRNPTMVDSVAMLLPVSLATTVMSVACITCGGHGLIAGTMFYYANICGLYKTYIDRKNNAGDNGGEEDVDEESEDDAEEADSKIKMRAYRRRIALVCNDLSLPKLDSVHIQSTLFLLWCLCTVTYLPSSIMWHKNMEFGSFVRLGNANFFILFLYSCAVGLLWSCNVPFLFAPYYRLSSCLLFGVACAMLLVCQVNIFRLPMLLTPVFVFVAVHQYYGLKTLKSQYLTARTKQD